MSPAHVSVPNPNDSDSSRDGPCAGTAYRICQKCGAELRPENCYFYWKKRHNGTKRRFGECKHCKKNRPLKRRNYRAPKRKQIVRPEPTAAVLLCRQEWQRVKAERDAWWAEQRPALQRRINLPWSVKELVSYMPRAS